MARIQEGHGIGALALPSRRAAAAWVGSSCSLGLALRRLWLGQAGRGLGQRGSWATRAGLAGVRRAWELGRAGRMGRRPGRAAGRGEKGEKEGDLAQEDRKEFFIFD